MHGRTVPNVSFLATAMSIAHAENAAAFDATCIDAGMLIPCVATHVAHAKAPTWTLFGCVKMLRERLTPEGAEVTSAAGQLAARRAGCVHRELMIDVCKWK